MRRHPAPQKNPDEKPQAQADATPHEPGVTADAGAETQPAPDADARVAALEAEVASRADELLRLRAEFQNYRRRNDEQARQTVQYANQELVKSLLPVIDNLERALAAAEQKHSFDALLEGVAMTVRQMLEVLERNGVKPIAAAGQPFDPALHEAVQRVEGSDQPDNTVVDELQRGYTMQDRVLRHSQVRVAVSE